MRFFRIRSLLVIALALGGVGVMFPVFGAGPSGVNWFQLFTTTQSGNDNTGDGGTGDPADYNYYYVGQTFTARTDVGISAGNPSNGADFMLSYDKNIVSASDLTPLSAYQYWTGQSVDNAAGQLTLSGYNDPGIYYSGQRSFTNASFTLLRPSAVNYSLVPTTLTINYTPGVTTDSNIARDGFDYMDSKEDFHFIVWADTKAPYGQRPTPSHSASAVAVESPYSFEVRDSKNGVGDDRGAGTGFSTATAGRSISVENGGASSEYLSYASYVYSGLWQSVCTTTVNPPSPLGISGDTRNWEYNKTYSVTVSGWMDRASPSQNQLGDPNGPNTMAPITWSFTTEADTAPPYVSLRNPAAGASGVSINTTVSMDVVDKKSASVSGVGVDPATCRINLSSPSYTLRTYAQGNAGITVTAVDYGYRYTITPSSPFAQNEIVSVSVYDCRDLVGNIMTTDNYTFWTSDTSGPYVTLVSPANHGTMAADGTISFHIKDDGGGVDLANTVVYVDGIYYTNLGSAGSVTTNGTRISYATSSNFNGGNYAGDLSAVSGASGDYAFSIKPQMAFAAGQSVPVLIYSRDASGNLMDRYVTSFTVSGATCNGSAYCGSNTSWSAGMCVGTIPAPAGGSCGGGGGATPVSGIGGTAFSVNEPVTVTQINDTSVLVSFFTNQASVGRVVYDTVSHASRGTAPSYGYAQTTAESSVVSTHHSFVVGGLQTGHLYYFLPAARWNGLEAIGPEMAMAPRYPTVVERTVEASPSTSDLCPSTIPIFVTPQGTITINQQPTPSRTPGKTQIPAQLEIPPQLVPPQQMPLVPAFPGIESPVSIAVPSGESSSTIIEPPSVSPIYINPRTLKIIKIEGGNRQFRLNGYAVPSSVLRIFIYSATPTIHQVQSDDRGEWMLDLSSVPPPGMHTIVVQDVLTGQQDSAFFYVDDSSASVITRIMKNIPREFFWLFVVLCLIILLLMLDLIRLAYRTKPIAHRIARDDEGPEHAAQQTCDVSGLTLSKKKERIDYRPHVLLLCFLAFLATIVAGLIFQWRTGYFSQLSQIQTTSVPSPITVSGTVIDPIDHASQKNVDLTVANTMIRTGADGRYAFDDINGTIGIRMTHPLLSRSVRWRFPSTPANQKIDLLFDPEMMNALIAFTNNEAMERWDVVLQQMPSDARAAVTMKHLRMQGSIFTANNLSDQELVIEKSLVQSTALIPPGNKTALVVRVRLAANGRTLDYLLTQEQGRWVIMQSPWK